MKALRILLVAAMAMMMVSSAFAGVDFGGEADWSVEFDSVEVGDADAVTNVKLGDGGNIQLKVEASKELDNGATAAVEARYDAKYDGVGQDYIRLKYMNGPLTVQMLKADRPGFMGKGKDVYVPQGPLYNCEWTNERDVSFQFAGEGMKFTGTLNFTGENKIAVRPAIEMGLGAATLKAAVEYISEFPTDTDADGPTVANFGGGAGIEAGLGAMTVGASAAYGVKGGTDDAGDDIDATNQMSFYAFMKMALGAGEFGVGGGYDMETIDNVDDDYTGYQVNVGFSHPIMVPGLSVEGGAGYAFNEGHDKVETTKTGGKFKVKYAY